MEKIKQFIQSEKGKDIMVVLIVILVGVGSFELGRLSKSSRSGGLKIEYTSPGGRPDGQGQAANVIYADTGANTAYTAQNKAQGGLGAYFASSRGTKYYPADCTAGQNIKEANKVWFGTREEAEQAGYELSGSCR